MKKTSRYPNLDLLRALAISLMVFYHCCNIAGVPTWLWEWSEVLGANSIDLFLGLPEAMPEVLATKHPTREGHYLRRAVRFYSSRLRQLRGNRCHP